jgi:hypothetical protein
MMRFKWFWSCDPKLEAEGSSSIAEFSIYAKQNFQQNCCMLGIWRHLGQIQEMLNLIPGRWSSSWLMSSRERGGKLKNLCTKFGTDIGWTRLSTPPTHQILAEEHEYSTSLLVKLIQCNRYTPQQSKSKQFQYAIVCPTDTTFQTPRDFFCFSFSSCCLTQMDIYI